MQMTSALPSRIPESEIDESSPKSALPADTAGRHRLANASTAATSPPGRHLTVATSIPQPGGLKNRPTGLEGSPRHSLCHQYGVGRGVVNSLGGSHRSSLLTHPSGDKFRFEAGVDAFTSEGLKVAFAREALPS